MVRKSIRPATAGPVSPTTSVLHNPQPWHVPASAAIDSFVHQPCERPTGRRRRGGRRRWALPVPGSVPNEAPSKQSEAQTILAGQRINKPSTWNRYLPPQLELSSFSPREAHATSHLTNPSRNKHPHQRADHHSNNVGSSRYSTAPSCKRHSNCRHPCSCATSVRTCPATDKKQHCPNSNRLHSGTTEERRAAATPHC